MIRAPITLGLLLAGTCSAQAASLPLIAMPASVATGQGALTIREGAGIVAPEAGGVAAILAARVKTERGLGLVPRATTGPIRPVRDAGAEDCAPTVTAVGATVAASTDAGLSYGAMTLAQLLSLDAAYGTVVRVPAMTIHDAPRFRWRGLMVNLARPWYTVAAMQLTERGR